MTSPQTLYTALGQLYTMLTVDRGLEAYPDVAIVLSAAPEVKLLPMENASTGRMRASDGRLVEIENGRSYQQTIDLLFQLNLLRQDAASHYTANVHTTGWLAENTRNLLFLMPTRDGRLQPIHSGVTYSVALIVVTPSDVDDTTSKLKKARVQLHKMIAGMQQSNLPVLKGRIVRLICGEAGKNVVPTKIEDAVVSLETWFTSELQTNPLEHTTVPLHVPLERLRPEDIARLPDSTRNAVIARDADHPIDVTQLDRLCTTDIVARWHSFAVGQLIIVERKHAYEGGVNYTIRFVR